MGESTIRGSTAHVKCLISKLKSGRREGDQNREGGRGGQNQEGGSKHITMHVNLII